MSEHTAIADHESPAESHGGHHGSVYSHVRPYLFVGYTLFALTLLTVGLSYIKFENIRILKWTFGKIGVHGFAINVVIGLCVAAFKVGLVGAWFMHLKSEKATIWRPLLFTFFFCLGLFLLCLLAYFDPIFSTSHTHH